MPSFHQSDVSFELHYELQNECAWPAVPLHAAEHKPRVMSNERVTRTKRRALYIAATLTSSSSSRSARPHHVCEVAHPWCTIATCMYRNIYHSSPGIDRQTRVHAYNLISRRHPPLGQPPKTKIHFHLCSILCYYVAPLGSSCSSEIITA